MTLYIHAFTATRRAASDPSHRWKSPDLHIVEQAVEDDAICVAGYVTMCDAIRSDTSASTNEVLAILAMLQTGELRHLSMAGNAWITHLTLHEIWFEGVHGQDLPPLDIATGGSVSLDQFELALRTYQAFLDDPTQTPRCVPLPPPLDRASLPPRPLEEDDYDEVYPAIEAYQKQHGLWP